MSNHSGEPAPVDVISGIDCISLRGALIFCSGWAFCPNDPVVRVDLESETGGAANKTLAAVYGNPRPDIDARHKGRPGAAHSGFYLYGMLGTDGAPARCELVLSLASGRTQRHALALKDVRPAPPRLMGGALDLRRVLGRAWDLAKRADFSTLRLKARRYFVKNPLPETDPLKRIKDSLRLAKTRDAALVVDHDLGGGANVYRETIIAGELAAGRSILLITFNVTLLQHVLEIITPLKREKFVLDRLERLLDVARDGLISQIIYNDAVSFDSPVRIPALLKTLSELAGAPLTFYVHDYLAVCPSHFLLNDAGVYCGIPDEKTCQGCLSRHADGFVSLHSSRDIRSWRAAWEDGLRAAETIVCSSESTRRHVLKAYPGLNVERIAVRLPAAPGRTHPAAVNVRAPLHLGVVGRISHHKGAEVVADLAREISHRGLKVPITVIGSLSAPVSVGDVHETGDYASRDLKRLIERSGANVFLFPSICPETFSFVTEELIQLRVPLLCFNLGAPAERVGKYAKGKVVEYRSSQHLLDDLIEFHGRMA